MDICSDDGHLHYGDDENEADDAQEPENVVVPALVLPQALEDEEEFDEKYRKGNETRKENGVDALGIPCLWWNLARNGARASGVLPRCCFDIAVPASSVDERYLDEKP